MGTLEDRKTELEIAELTRKNRWWFLFGTALISGLPLLLSVGGNVYQWIDSDKVQQAADLDRKTADANKALAELQTAQLEQKSAALQTDIASLQTQKDALDKMIADLNKEKSDAEEHSAQLQAAAKNVALPTNLRNLIESPPKFTHLPTVEEWKTMKVAPRTIIPATRP